MDLIISTLMLCVTIAFAVVTYVNYKTEEKRKEVLSTLIINEKEYEHKEKMLRNVLSYRKYHDTRLMEHRENLEVTKGETYSDIASNIVGNLGLILNKYTDEYLKIALMGTVELPTQIEALNKIINTEFNNYVVLPRIGKMAKPPITNMQETTQIVAGKVIDCLQPSFFDTFETHGLSRAYVMSYISRQITEKVIMYSQEIRQKKEE